VHRKDKTSEYLFSLHEHLRELGDSVKTTRFESNYSSVLRIFELAKKNFSRAIAIAEFTLENALEKEALKLVETSKEDKNFFYKNAIEVLLQTPFKSLIANLYDITEKICFDYANVVRSNFPHELYLWINDLLTNMNVYVPILFEQHNMFSVKSFSEKLGDTSFLKFYVDLNVPGTQKSIELMRRQELHERIRKDFPIDNGWIIYYTYGEIYHLLSWPLLFHEAFEVIHEERLISVTDKLMTVSELPQLDNNPETNRNYWKEIFIDFLTINYVGPLYIASLLDFFSKSPYTSGQAHPDAGVRLYALSKYKELIPDRYLEFCVPAFDYSREGLAKDLERCERFKTLRESEKIAIDSMSRKLNDTVRSMLGENTYDRKIDDYVGGKFSPGIEPIYKANEIPDMLIEKNISLAIDPSILLNTIIPSNKFDSHQHLERVLQSMKKYYVKKVFWKLSSEQQAVQGS